MRKLSLFLFCIVILVSCKKGTEPVDDHNSKLVQITSDKIQGGSFRYNDQNQITDVAGFINPSTTEKYIYNNQGQITGISTLYSSAETRTKEFVINYQNNLPVSGRMKYNPNVGSKDINPIYYVDSLTYKTSNGNVTEIKFFDRKTYHAKTNVLLAFSTDTVDNYKMTYSNGNLLSVKSRYLNSTFTFGSKKGVVSSNKLKFVLNPEDNAILFSSNDLLESIINNTISDEVKTVYTYTYNQFNFPISSEVKRSWKSSSVVDNFSLTFQYE